MNIDWKNIEDRILGRFAEQMRQTPQTASFHGEGDVLTHTLMVHDALKSMPEYHSLSEGQKHILSAAALLHDVGKIPTSRVETKYIVADNHAPVGSRMAREFLWKELNMCGKEELVQIREAICLLIRYHSFPPHAIDVRNAQYRLHKIASNGLLAPNFSVRHLCLLARADILGRICEDKQRMLDQIDLCEALAEEEDCIDICYPFPDEHTRRAYLAGAEVWKKQKLYDETWGEVILMSGLPGTGKDTWIANILHDSPMISLDYIRRTNKISPTADQGVVANIAREQAKELLRSKQPFVWNATNITEQTRESLVNLFETYRARVRIVYLETEWQSLQQRNINRPYPVPQSAIDKMLHKLTLPSPHEAEKVDWIFLDGKNDKFS